MDVAHLEAAPTALPAPQGSRSSFLPSETRLGAAVVAAAGASLGAFTWYVLATHGRSSSNFFLAASVVLGVLISVGLWLAYARIASGVIGVAYRALLHADAYSYLPMFFLWFYLAGSQTSLASATALFGTVLLAWIAIKIGALAKYSLTARAVAAVFVATRIPLIIVAALGAIVIGQRAGTHWSPEHGILDVLGRWDAQHYLAIATVGYHGKDVAFFPLYPLLINQLGGLIGDHFIAGVVISNLAFFVALAYLYALTKLEFGEHETAYHAIFYIAIFPTAIFFSAVYSESLFLALTVASVYYARRGNFITAGIIGALASLTRVEGVLLVLPIAYEVWRAWHERRGTTLVRGVIGLALVPAGIALFMGYLYALVGDPLYFQKVQANWNRHLAPPWVSISNTFEELSRSTLASSNSVNHILELAFTLAFLALLVAAFRQLRPSYAWYFAASLLVPMSTASLMSMPRFDLVVFPAFMLLAVYGRRPVVNSAIVALSLTLLGVFTVFFADWYWLA
ncbi:MAG TPA: mannosyltransferase family protein [Candidatus Eremiobacteraceae bacterium]|nr:mannosyltransferase family protein [Candidatus Eremiobacteraceae bacterium]